VHRFAAHWVSEKKNSKLTKNSREEGKNSREEENSPFIYRFDPDVKNANDTPVTMAWSIELNKHRWPLFGTGKGLFDKEPVEAIGMLGERQIVEPSEGDTYFELGPVPVYLRT